LDSGIWDGVGLQKSNSEDAGESDFVTQAYLESPDQRHGKTEHDDVGADNEGSGNDVGCDLLPARSIDGLIPVKCKRSAQEEAAEDDAESPEDDDNPGGSRYHNEPFDDEDPHVET
jgi:hypothetical protein